MPGTMMDKDDAQAALLFAVAQGRRPDPALWDLWLWSGADINAPCPDSGKTALMAAAESGVPDDIAYLLLRNAAVDARNPHNAKTALMYAAASENMPVIECLLAAGANPLLRDHNQWLPADHAKAGTAAARRLSPVIQGPARAAALANSAYARKRPNAAKFKLRP